MGLFDKFFEKKKKNKQEKMRKLIDKTIEDEPKESEKKYRMLKTLLDSNTLF
ncbi:hypothetical protein P7M42_26665 [Vibrio parahaemolyticus]|nr:hypothetical protein [Vibrio parahaemolyticus]MDG2794693.1 hypothetical protein [Vibrio parahaemolyticus]